MGKEGDVKSRGKRRSVSAALASGINAQEDEQEQGEAPER